MPDDFNRTIGSEAAARSVDPVEADRVRQIIELYLECQSRLPTVTELNRRG